MFEVLCAAYEPPSVSTLAQILHWSVYEQHDVLASFGSLFYTTQDEEEALRPFQSSVLEWVQDSRNAGPYYAVPV